MKMRWDMMSAAVSALVFAAGWGICADVVLVENGAPKAQIVLRKTADDTEKLAAQELVLYLKKSSGAELPVTTEPLADVMQVLIGVDEEVVRRALGLASLPFDGFVEDCSENRLVLAGNVPEGTLNAVYGFLEERLGVRWYVPTELGENVPRHATIRVPAGRRRVEPRFVNRRNHGIDLSIRGDGAVWRRRVRITSHSLDVPFNRYSHWLYRVFPPSVYGKAHPEYYPLIGGKRRVPETNNAQNWQPCTTNPEVLELTIAAARKWFKEHPRSNFFSVGMNDSGAFCECDKCTALDIPGETFRGRKMLSDRYYTFVNAVADAIKESNPDKYVTCIAYHNVETLPKRVKIRDNVGVIITQDVAQWHDPEYKKKDMEFATAWAEAAGAFGTYDYTGLTWLLPRVYPHAMAESLRFYDRVGAVAVTNEAFPTWWYAAPQMYLRAKLMWDPKQDPDKVLDEFYDGFFGPAQKPMSRFYSVLERCMMKKRDGRWFEGLGSVLQQLALWEPEDLAECKQAMTQAKKLARGREPFAARVDFVARGFAFTDAVLEEYWRAGSVQELSAEPALSATRLVRELQTLVERRETRESVWNSIKDDRLVSGIYRLLFNNYSSRVATWRSYLDSSISMAVSALTIEPGGIAIDQVLRNVPAIAKGSLGEELRGMAWARKHPAAPNLCDNPGFEAAKSDAKKPEGVNWVATDTPPAWSKWALQRETEKRMTWESGAGRNGSRCIKIVGGKDACFIHVVPTSPGERYHVSVWARSVASEKARTRLVVQWKDADGAWVWSKPRRMAVVPRKTRDWRNISLVFTVPEGVGQAVILLCAKDQEARDETFFDDLRLVKLPTGE
ncbi:MAG: DUF4838 domain-containing protein [Lentisphaeria bacterium]|nr:DUF4838 domain-containing protein [Lentisphaeria bacterium]